MDGSGEEERQASDEILDEVVEISAKEASPAARKTPRRSVQKKLSFYLPTHGNEGEEGDAKRTPRRKIRPGKADKEEEEEDVKRTPRRKVRTGKADKEGEEEDAKRTPRRKVQSGKADKELVTLKDAGADPRGKRSLPTVVKGSDFFLKTSEKKLKQKYQIEQEEDHEESKGGVESFEKTDIQKLDLRSNQSSPVCQTKKTPTKWWLKKGKASPKRPGFKGLDEDKPIIDLSNNDTSNDSSTEEIRPIHPFFSQGKANKGSVPLSSKLNRSNYSEPEHHPFTPCPPIHISDILQNDIGSLDWGSLEIQETSLLNISKFLPEECSFLLNCSASVGPMKLDGIVPSNEDTSSMLFNKRQSSDRKDLQNKESHAPVAQIIIHLDDVPNEQNDELLTKSTTSSKKRHFIKDYLWTDKHKPEKASEVCGNVGPVKFLVDWLSSWQERYKQNCTYKVACIDTIESDFESGLGSEFDSENEDEHSLRNVLVVTGPVGCGKTAAIYASARELNFNVIEVNASDVRNGAHIKQKFGEAMDSHRIEIRSAIDTAHPNLKQSLRSIDSSISQKLGLKQTSTLFNNAKVKSCGASSKSESPACRVANKKNLLLFEDVDAILQEDRGFFTTIMQLAETSKRPIILTMNSQNLSLPSSLDKQIISFTRPSREELLSCLNLVCSSEGATVSPKLLEQLITTCEGDIRKAILLLQFWCQDIKVKPDRNMKLTYSPLHLDLDSAHKVIENILPWGIPCQLALKIEEEISKPFSSPGGEEEDFQPLTEKVNINECSSPEHDDMGFSDNLSSPMTYLKGSRKRRSQTVVSSPEEDPTHADSPASSKSYSHVCDTYNSFCPETEISTRDGLTSAEVSSHQFPLRVSEEEQDYGDNKTILITDEETRMNFSNVDEVEGESGHGIDSSQEAYHIMDEWSCVGFDTGLDSVEIPVPEIVGLVDQKWKRFRSCPDDFKLDSSFDCEDVFRILNLTASLTHLISDADILLGRCRLLTRDVMEPSETPTDEPCSSSWYDEHLEMASIFSHHGFCLYASKAAASSPSFCYENSLHLGHEMLAASSSSMALGKLLSHENTITVVREEREIQKKTSRELGSNICDAVRPLIPARLQMMLHSTALHEYISSLSFISKAEKSRLSGNSSHVRSLRRNRAPCHYLRSLPVVLSPEKMEFYAGYGCFGSLDFR